MKAGELPALLVHLDTHLVGITRRPRDRDDTPALRLNRCGCIFTEQLPKSIDQRTAGHISHIDLVLLILRHAVLLSSSMGSWLVARPVTVSCHLSPGTLSVRERPGQPTTPESAAFQPIRCASSTFSDITEDSGKSIEMNNENAYQNAR